MADNVFNLPVAGVVWVALVALPRLIGGTEVLAASDSLLRDRAATRRKILLIVATQWTEQVDNLALQPVVLRNRRDKFREHLDDGSCALYAYTGKCRHGVSKRHDALLMTV